MKNIRAKYILAGAACLPLLISSCVSNQQFMSAQNEIDRLKQDSIQAVRATELALEQAEDLKDQNEVYQTKLEQTKAELSEKETLLTAATRKAVDADLKLQNIADDLNMFESEFSEVVIEDGKVKLNMEQSILFKQGSDEINWQGDILLERLAATLKKVDDVEMIITGHTDPVPVKGEDNNWDLSVDRSIAVVEKLTKEYGVSPEILVAAGKSKFDPAVPNNDEDMMAKNRRVEFIIMPDLEAIEEKIDD